MSKKLKYRVEVNYFTRDYDDRILLTSSPHYSLETALEEIVNSVDKRCVDDSSVGAEITLLKYTNKGTKLKKVWSYRRCGLLKNDLES